MGQGFGREAEHGPQVHRLGNGGAAPVPAVGEGPVQGGDETDRTSGPRPLDPGGDLVPCADPVDLEERLRVGRDDVLHRHAGERAQAHGGPAGGCGLGHGHLASWVHGLDAGGGDEHGERDLLAHDLGGEIPTGGKAGRVGGEAELAVGSDVVLHRDPAFGTCDQRPVDRLGQALFGAPLRLGHRFEPLVSHNRETLRASAGAAPLRAPGAEPDVGSAACPSQSSSR